MERMPPQQRHPLAGGRQQGPPLRRFSEPAKFLPVIFLVCTILGLYLLFVLTHCLALIQVDVPYQHQDNSMRQRGIVQLVIFHCITILLSISYVRCILESPGVIPENDPRWIYIPPDRAAEKEVAPSMNLQELKKSGDRRHCKWCSRYKPDRCHHCRVCRTCVLKMDHHCPWIYNCVGFGNYKYFFLVLFYAVADTHFIVFTMAESVSRSVETQAPFLTMFLTIFGVSLAFWMGLILTLFFGFHVWLMFRAMTIIEFCEKSSQLRTDDKTGENKSAYLSAYSQGPLGNVCAVLGDNPFLWLLPLNPPSGDGLTFITDESRLMQEPPVKQKKKKERNDHPDQDYG